jgi:hypothetical protein
MTEAGKSWTLEVQKDPDTQDFVLQLPWDLLEQVGWSEGDVLTWADNQDGTWSLRLASDPGPGCDTAAPTDA